MQWPKKCRVDTPMMKVEEVRRDIESVVGQQQSPSLPPQLLVSGAGDVECVTLY